MTGNNERDRRLETGDRPSRFPGHVQDQDRTESLDGFHAKVLTDTWNQIY